MPTDTRPGAGALCALALLLAACARPASEAAGATDLACPIPESLPQPHRPGWCALPGPVRTFAEAHEAQRGFSGGEPSSIEAMHALQAQAEQRLRDQRAHWARLRARYAQSPDTAGWLDRYAEETQLR